MPRNVPAGLVSRLALGTTTLCLLYRLVRKDGFELGFTSTNQKITYNGLAYEPADGMSGTAIETEVGTGAGNTEVMGVITSDRITEAHVGAGLWRGAEIWIYRADWSDITLGAMVEWRGFIGKVEQGRIVFTADCESLASLLRQVVGWQTSKNCPCRRLGNAQCKVVMSGSTVGGVPIRANKSLSSGSGTALVFGSDSAPTGHYSHGVVKFTSGPNANIERDVKSHTLSGGNANIVLRTPFPFTVTPGETALLEAGCDRTKATCIAKYNNYNNYHGQFDVLGNEKAMQVGRPPG